MKIIYFGSGEFGINCLNALADSAHELVFIVTQPPQPAGRGRKECPTQISHWANMHLVPFVETADVNAPEIIEQITGYRPDLIIVIAFGQKVGCDLINLPPKGAINVHASLLPKYRGAAPINWAIIKGETKTGNSIITLSDKIDAGQILAQNEVEIVPEDTAGSLHDKLAQSAAPLLLETVEKIAAGTSVYTEQDHSKATYAPKLTKTDGYLDFAEPASVLATKIHGFWPWPGASVDYISKKTNKSSRVTIAMAKIIESSNPAGLPVGTLDENLNIVCGENALRVTRIKPSGSALMDFRCFVNGRRTQPGDLFKKIDRG